MKKIILLLSLMFTFTASAQYGILSAVQLNEGAEDQYLALEAFFGPVHDLAIEKGIENFQAVWKVTSDSADENAPHYIIYTGFEFQIPCSIKLYSFNLNISPINLSS